MLGTCEHENPKRIPLFVHLILVLFLNGKNERERERERKEVNASIVLDSELSVSNARTKKSCSFRKKREIDLNGLQ